jgi:hypothetical protein
MSVDSFSVLFRRSRLATFHPNIPQLYRSAKKSECNALNEKYTCTFGLKRPIPHLSSDAIVTFQSLTGPFGKVNYAICTKKYEAFDLLRRLANSTLSSPISNDDALSKRSHPLFGSTGTNSTVNTISSDPIYVQGQVLRKLKDDSLLINIQDCWVGLLSAQDELLGIDARYLWSSTDQIDKPESRPWHRFRVKSFSWDPKNQTAKIYLSLSSST